MIKTRTLLASLLAVAGTALAAPTAGALTLNPWTVPDRTEISVRNIDGTVFSVRGDRPGPALSLAKLYLAYGVLAAGDPADRDAVTHMIRTSDDLTASRLSAKHPTAIADTVNRFGLHRTHAGPDWGSGVTTTDDVVRFLTAVRDDPTAAPIIDAMATAAPVAADGYHQNYGTATLPGSRATKFGWSDDGTINATATYGNGWTAAARTYGPPDQLTRDVHTAVVDSPAPQAPGPAGPPPGSGSWAVTGAQLKHQVRCADPLNLRHGIPDTVLIPTMLASALPRC
ncbi:class A beta-lactamase-related serine hydrolase [Corynebacterium pygosceleis]|uniref:class A beta-lactamase-related serine hydrolase n=1 Tax=Corynebacterium pygosceleis TaxID=2800406 RepID=UPI002002B0FB|nr:class A beta-lactamase-related serine hydrolase [Corynebacterium pygosceleis]